MTPSEKKVLQHLLTTNLDESLAKHKGKSGKGDPISRVSDIMANYLAKRQVLDFVYGHIMQTEFPQGNFNPRDANHIERYVNCCSDMALTTLYDKKGNVQAWVSDLCELGGQVIDNNNEDLKNALIDGFIFQGAQTALIVKHGLKGAEGHAIRAYQKELIGAPDRKKISEGETKKAVKPIKQLMKESRIRKTDKLTQDNIIALQSTLRIRKEALTAFDKFERDQRFCLDKMNSSSSGINEYPTLLYQYLDNYQKIEDYIDKIPDVNIKAEMIEQLESIDKDHFVNKLNFTREFDEYNATKMKAMPKYMRTVVMERNTLLATFHRVMRDVSTGKVDLNEANEVLKQIDKFNKNLKRNPLRKSALKQFGITEKVERTYAGLAVDGPSVRNLVSMRALDEHITVEQLKIDSKNMSALVEDHLQDIQWLLEDAKGAVANPAVFATLESLIRDEHEVLEQKVLPSLDEHLKLLYKTLGEANDPDLRKDLITRIADVHAVNKDFKIYKMKLDLLQQTCAYHENRNASIKDRKEHVEISGVTLPLKKLDTLIQKRYGKDQASTELQETFLKFADELKGINPYCKAYVATGKGMKNKCSAYVRKNWEAPVEMTLSYGRTYDLNSSVSSDLKHQNGGKSTNGKVKSDSDLGMDWKVNALCTEMKQFSDPTISNYDGVDRKKPTASPATKSIVRSQKMSNSISNEVWETLPPTRQAKLLKAANDESVSARTKLSTMTRLKKHIAGLGR